MLRVLVVNGRPDTGRGLTSLVRQWGYDALVADDGETALELAGLILPDVVLLDVSAPQPNGYELARRLRAILGMDGVCMVALTDLGANWSREEAYDAGFHAFVPTQYHSDSLRDLLAAYGGGLQALRA